jgi:hypothetical protein
VLSGPEQLAAWHVRSVHPPHSTRWPQLFRTSPHFGAGVPTPHVASRLCAVQQRSRASHVVVPGGQHLSVPAASWQQIVSQPGPGVPLTGV